YLFAPGAVGAMIGAGRASIAEWVSEGVTATWGSTSEDGDTNGDALLQHLWSGRSFGEAAYLAAPRLNWKSLFVGDPLYTPISIESAPQRKRLERYESASGVGAPAALVTGGSETIAVGSASGVAGGTVTLNLTLTSAGGAQPSGLQ